ncbi:MAG: hypothetical protein A2498_08015 [Lentisphaerae bacterium RIFOXYC12_FULL_60_16]|nr:MAG: hypothetical protein A2498_08015 [Lentisphaerae bacterium RIFOXYC12_FULL_60_16]
MDKAEPTKPEKVSAPDLSKLDHHLRMLAEILVDVACPELTAAAKRGTENLKPCQPPNVRKHKPT